MKRKIKVVEYDSGWKHAFEIEARNLREIFGEEIITIHHIGSTSVPGLMAKPIIDMLPVVRDIKALDAYDEIMAARGYIPRGEFGLPGRRYFIKGTEVNRTHHIHAYQEGHADITRHLAFRDYLLTHPGRARDYETLKLELIKRFDGDKDAYIDGKDGLVKEIEAEALCWYLAK